MKNSTYSLLLKRNMDAADPRYFRILVACLTKAHSVSQLVSSVTWASNSSKQIARCSCKMNQWDPIGGSCELAQILAFP